MGDERSGTWRWRAPDLGVGVQYGPDIGSEADIRLLGTVTGKRVLDLGCGGGQNAIVLAKQGAHVIGLDPSADQLAAARRWCEKEEVRVELHQGDLADLAFVRADSIDLAVSAYGMGEVPDLNRVYRQVHRVLRQGSPFVFSIPHPAYDLIDDADPDEPLLVRRSYFDRGPLETSPDGSGTACHHTISDIYTGLTRNNFRVDVVLEPEPTAGAHRSPFWQEAFRWLPRTLVVRARKEGL